MPFVVALGASAVMAALNLLPIGYGVAASHAASRTPSTAMTAVVNVASAWARGEVTL